MMKRPEFLILVLLGTACGSTPGSQRSLPDQDPMLTMRNAIGTPVSTPEQSAEHSRLVESLVSDAVFEGMSRAEIEAAIGRGDPCSRHPRCAENEFSSGDWFYDVGTFDGVQVPLLIIGFDPAGRADRTWNLRTHR